MKSIFDEAVRKEVIARVNSLSAENKPAWGIMTPPQMVKHCAKCEEYYMGRIPVKRSLLGRIVGKMAIRSILKNEASGMQKNAPTSPLFKSTETGLDLEQEKNNWVKLIKEYSYFQPESFTHWFFGKMTKEQLGQFIYKHTDHHLTQFGV